MKKLKFVAILFLVTAFFANCRKENQQTKVNPDLMALQRQGFDIKGIVEKKDYYIVEGDIMIYKKDVNNLSRIVAARALTKLEGNKGAIEQAYTGTTVVRSTITVYVDPSMPVGTSDDWRPAVNQAMANWNAINNFSMQFVLTTSSGADITILPDYGANQLPSGVYGSGAFPAGNGSAPGTTIIFHVGGSLNSSLMELVATHEMGHTIAFRHTDYYYEGGATLITGTIPSTSTNPDPDPYSVMTTGGNQATQSWRGFDATDILAARMLYPLDPTQEPLYRYATYNGGRHFYTSSWSEIGSGSSSYRYEGPSGYIYNYAAPGTVPFYRWYNSSSNDHFYQTSSAGVVGYGYEGIVGYVYTSQVAGTIPLYRYNNRGVHFYTINYSELGSGGGGYSLEGVACYVRP